MKLPTYSPYHCKIRENLSLRTEIKQGYYRFASRETALCRDEPWMSWLCNAGMKGFINVAEGNSYEYYVHEESFLKVLGSLANEIIENWKEHIKKYEERKQKAWRIAHELAIATRSKNKEKITAKYLEYLQEMYNFCDYVWGAWGVIHHLEPEVMKSFPDKIGLIMSLEQPIEFMKMQQGLFTLSKEQWIRDFGWLKVYSPYDIPYMEHDFETMKKELAQQEVKAQHQDFSKVKREFARFLEEITDRSMKAKVQAVHTYAFLKTDRIDVWKKAMATVAEFYSYIASLVPGHSLKDATNFSATEILTVLQEGKAPAVDHTQKRSRNEALYYVHEGVVEVTIDKKSITEAKRLLQGEIKTVTELKGVSACPGKAVGRVKIIMHSLDCTKVQEGDIFVAKYTFPSFTPYMVKCAAIVTDEGGITSHAAIISREYKKPCVIGTKIATRVLKDGDKVEVDAVKGIVRIRK